MIGDYYRETYGEESPLFAPARYTQAHYPMSQFEPSVAEHLFNQVVSAKMNITTLLSHCPVEVVREGALIRKVAM